MKLIPSEKIKGYQNLLFTTPNGLKLSYTDGIVDANFKGDSVDIEGSYLIETEIGTFKISYHPKSAKLYWVFEKIQH